MDVDGIFIENGIKYNEKYYYLLHHCLRIAGW